MAVSNINHTSSIYSFDKEHYSVVMFWDDFIKFMVSGGDPLGIEKIVITGGVARVTTVEKNFNGNPGIKFDIAGTNNVKVDGRNEVQAVFTDGFSFNTDAANATFTNGLTYSLSPLGWSLITRTAKHIVFKSGPSAETPFYLVLEPRGGAWCHFICYDYETTNYKESVWPSAARNNFTSYFPMLTEEAYNGSYSGGVDTTTYRFRHWMYGDDAFLVIHVGLLWGAADAPKNTSPLAHGSMAVVGELKSHINARRFQMVAGYSSGAAYLTDNGGSFLITYGTNNILNNNNGTSVVCNVGLKNYDGKSINYQARPAIIDGKYSGYRREFTTPYIANFIRFKPIEMLNSESVFVGTIPGCYYIDGTFPNMSHSTISMYKVSETNLKNRNCVAAPFYVTNNSSIQASYIGYTLLDLTGPIR